MQCYRLGLCALGFAGALLASTAALAGFRSVQGVVIFEHAAQGDLGYVSNTADKTQYLGCYSFGGWGNCYARNTAGQSASCTTSDATLLRVIRSLNGDSDLYFVWDNSGRCTRIIVDTSSYKTPKR